MREKPYNLEVTTPICGGSTGGYVEIADSEDRLANICYLSGNWTRISGLIVPATRNIQTCADQLNFSHILLCNYHQCCYSAHSWQLWDTAGDFVHVYVVY